MHQPKREYNQTVLAKKEDKQKAKTICCVNCGKVLAEGNIKEGTLNINCRHCGTNNVIAATTNDKIGKDKAE